MKLSVLLVFAISFLPCTLCASSLKTVSKENLLSIDFPNETRRNILRNVADIFEINANLNLPDDILDEKVSLKLRNVTWYQIFRETLEGTDYVVSEENGVVKFLKRNDPRHTINLARDALLVAKEERQKLREAISLLGDIAGPQMSPDVRKAVDTFLADPVSSTDVLLQELRENRSNQTLQRTPDTQPVSSAESDSRRR